MPLRWASSAVQRVGGRPPTARAGRAPLLGFTPSRRAPPTRSRCPTGYVADVIIPWGTPLRPTGRRGGRTRPTRPPTSALQVGAHHDGMHFFPLDDGGKRRRRNRRGLLVLNHEYIDRTIHYTDGDAVHDPGEGQQGVGRPRADRHRGRARRRQVAARTGLALQPAVHAARLAGHVRRARGRRAPGWWATARGTARINNCSMGHTPWGTYLPARRTGTGTTAHSTRRSRPTRSRPATGSTGSGSATGGSRPTRCGTSPSTATGPTSGGGSSSSTPSIPTSTPVKHTALGRVKHEGALVTEWRGRIVVYIGDDQDKDYLYKFVSSGQWREMRADGVSPLDEGTLYVARFNDDGTGDWVPLELGKGNITLGNGFTRPGRRVAAHAPGGRHRRGDEARPPGVDRREPAHRRAVRHAHERHAAVRTPSTHGSPTRTATSSSGGSGATTRRRPSSSGTCSCSPATRSTTRPSSSPTRTSSARPTGCTSTATAGCGSRPTSPTRRRTSPAAATTGSATTRCSPPTRGPARSGASPIGPRGLRAHGRVTTPDRETMFVNVQHPGEATTAWGTPTPANPRAVSNWPDFDPDGPAPVGDGGDPQGRRRHDRHLIQEVPPMRSLTAATVAAVLLLGVPTASASASGRDDDHGRRRVEPTLVRRATLPATYLAPGPPSGRLATPANGRTGPCPGQVIPGFSGMVDNGDGTFWAMPDNGFGTKANSADFLLRLYHVTPDWETADGGAGEIDRRRVHLAARPRRSVIRSRSSTRPRPSGCSPAPTSTSSRSCGRRTARSGSARSSARSCSTSTPTEAPRRARSSSPTASRRRTRSSAPASRRVPAQPRLRGDGRVDGRPRRCTRSSRARSPTTRTCVAAIVYEFDTSRLARTPAGHGSTQTDADGQRDRRRVHASTDDRMMVIERDDFQGPKSVIKRLYEIDLPPDRQGRASSRKELVVDLLRIANPDQHRRRPSCRARYGARRPVRVRRCSRSRPSCARATAASSSATTTTTRGQRSGHRHARRHRDGHRGRPATGRGHGEQAIARS